MQYFSVKKPLRIAGKTFIPCVCYKLPEILEKTVQKLVEESKAVIYDDPVYFQTGKLLKAKEETPVNKKKAGKKGV